MGVGGGFEGGQGFGLGEGGDGARGQRVMHAGGGEHRVLGRHANGELALTERAEQEHHEDEGEDDGQHWEEQLEVLKVDAKAIARGHDQVFADARIEGQAGDAEGIAADLVEADGGGDGAGDTGLLGGGDALIEDDGDAEALDGTRGLLGGGGSPGDLIVRGGLGARVLAVASGGGICAAAGAAVRPRAGDVADVEVAAGVGLGDRGGAARHGRAGGGELIGDGGDLVEIEGGADGDGAAAGADDAGERIGDVALEGEFVLALELELGGGRAGGERLGESGAIEEDAAGVIDDGDAALLEAFDRIGDQVGDAADLLVVEAGAGLELEEDAGGSLGLVFLEDGFLRHGDVDAAGADAGEGVDGAGEFTFEAAAEVDLLDEVGGAEVGLIEDLEADGAALREAGLGEADADFGHLVRGDGDG